MALSLTRRRGGDSTPINGKEGSNVTTSNLREVLFDISGGIGDEQLEDMKFLLEGKVDKRKLEDCKRPLTLLNHLMEIGFISDDNTWPLQSILDRIGCWSLRDKLLAYHVAAAEDIEGRLDITHTEEYTNDISYIKEFLCKYYGEFGSIDFSQSNFHIEEYRSLRISPDSTSGSEEQNNDSDFLTNLNSREEQPDTPIILNGPSDSAKSELAKKITSEWRQGRLDSFSLAFYLRSNRVTQDDIIDAIFDQLPLSEQRCSKGNLANYISRMQKSVLFIIDGCDGDQTKPSGKTAYDVCKMIKQSLFYGQCTVVFTADN